MKALVICFLAFLTALAMMRAAPAFFNAEAQGEPAAIEAQ